MADGEDALSDSSEITEEITYFKCCKNQKCSVKVCINCSSFYHKSCARYSNLKILADGKLICCERSNSDELQQEGEETKCDGKQKMLLMEIRYLKELLKESKEKKDILKLNNSLLLERIELMSKYHKNPEVNKRYLTVIPNTTDKRQPTILQVTSICQEMAPPTTSYRDAVKNTRGLQMPVPTGRKNSTENPLLSQNTYNKQRENDKIIELKNSNSSSILNNNDLNNN